MSRIGKLPISIPENVTIEISDDKIKVKGPKGELSLTFEPIYVSIKQEEKTITVTPKNETKEAKSRHGLYRSLIANMIEGVNQGFSKTLEIKGVGYRGSMKGNALEMNLGYSHPISYTLPEGIQINFAEKSQNILTVSGIDKQLVGQVSAEIRSFRKPEPYKGKGIKYQDEIIRRKAGKSVAKKG